MTDAEFPYQDWVSAAFRDVLRKALTQMADSGVCGEHHFFINFETGFDGVRIPGFLKAQYPDEITIVLQHQFEDLEVSPEAFQVTLSFSGQKHRLYIPFEAVMSFADPSVNFGLQMGMLMGENEDGDEVNESTAPIPVGTDAESVIVEVTEDQAAEGGGASGAQPGAEVIALDAFRKK